MQERKKEKTCVRVSAHLSLRFYWKLKLFTFNAVSLPIQSWKIMFFNSKPRDLNFKYDYGESLMLQE